MDGFACREARRLSDAYVDLQLPFEARLHMVNHLNRCIECRDFVEEKTRCKSLVRRAVSGVRAPDRLRDDIRMLIRHRLDN